jgi:DNA-binding Lrp family transcriptional regulator
MDALLTLLQANSRRTAADLAAQLQTTEADVAARIAAAEEAGTILGYQAVVDQSKVSERGVRALIEVKVSPDQGGGFDRLARRLSQYDQVSDVVLMSGDYDLAVVVQGKDLYDVARFVSEKLSTLPGVLSTATLFELKVYKQAGFIVDAGLARSGTCPALASGTFLNSSSVAQTSSHWVWASQTSPHPGPSARLRCAPLKKAKPPTLAI